MADRNRNGVDDRYEGRSAWRQSQPTPRTVQPNQGIGQIGDWWTDIVRQGQNFAGNIGQWLSGREPERFGAGDYAFGITPTRARREASRGTFGGVFQRPEAVSEEAPMQDTSLPSFMDFIRQAQESGIGGVGGDFTPVSYDPLRNDARGRATEYDAKLASMYRQLQSEMQGGNERLDQSYAENQAGQAERGAAAQQQIQNASNVADERNAQIAENLGQGEAVARIIAEGRDLNTDTARAVQDAAARQQIGAEQLTQNRQSADEYGTRLVGAAGMEGVEQRDRIQSELASLLAQYDMQEQQANQQLQAQQQQAQQQSLSNVMGLANSMYQDSWKQREYQDELSRFLFEQQSAAAPQDRFQLGIDRLGALQGQPWAEGMDPNQLAELMKVITGAGKL